MWAGVHSLSPSLPQTHAPPPRPPEVSSPPKELTGVTAVITGGVTIVDVQVSRGGSGRSGSGPLKNSLAEGRMSLPRQLDCCGGSHSVVASAALPFSVLQRLMMDP